ncbi:hypothetical protein ACROYT_G018433 [Oculina patagonica]
MKIAFAIFLCVILGVTSAKHLINGEYEGFETDDDVAQLMDNTMYDEEEAKIVTSHLVESLKDLAKCLENGDFHGCFRKFKEEVKLPPASKCFDDFERCFTSGSPFFVCADAFKACVHSTTNL